ncbi:MAG TPA: nucleotidyltransferase family protein [Burkholderiales bacterium]|nr:nucleotidyltransferase family protein [Burkholderiales bacterium]
MKAMILAAGRGERMRPLTDRTPKPLLPVGGEPLIVRIIRSLASSGVEDIVVNISHLGEQIELALGTGAAYRVSIRYSRETVALETAGGIALALPLLGEEPFIVVNADICTDFDFSRLYGRVNDSVRAHLVLVDNPPHHPGGDFALADGKVRESGEARLTFAGIGIYDPALFAGVERGSRHQLAPLLRAAMAERAVTGEHHRGYWSDVGTPARLAEVDALVRAGGMSRTQESA